MNEKGGKRTKMGREKKMSERKRKMGSGARRKKDGRGKNGDRSAFKHRCHHVKDFVLPLLCSFNSTIDLSVLFLVAE